jgi:hypothetical protein
VKIFEWWKIVKVKFVITREIYLVRYKVDIVEEQDLSFFLSHEWMNEYNYKKERIITIIFNLNFIIIITKIYKNKIEKKKKKNYVIFYYVYKFVIKYIIYGIGISTFFLSLLLILNSHSLLGFWVLFCFSILFFVLSLLICVCVLELCCVLSQKYYICNFCNCYY